jgi:hypothetical protein
LEPQREQALLSLDSSIIRLLREACDDDEAVGVYLDVIVQERLKAWRHGIRVLEREGWSASEVRWVAERLDNVLRLEFSSAAELTQGLRGAGLRRFGKRIARSPDVRGALQAVLAELRANNHACSRAVGLMKSEARPSWWRQLLR